ncbi:MAG: M28 family peptidase [Longimicrobiales bacterium]
MLTAVGGPPNPPRSGTPDSGQATFDADSAYAHVRTQVGFGPRVPGSTGHAAQLEWMAAYLRERADTVLLQSFEHETSSGQRLELTNVFARFAPAAGQRILLLAHWDTRPTADMERSEDRRKQPIPGANDGASGTAVLLELANVLSRYSPRIGVDLLFVDGEDYGPDADDMYLGARHFAAHLPAGYRPMYGILLDMVGDRDPVFEVEGNSEEMAPEIVERVWRLADELGFGNTFRDGTGTYVADDHLPLNRAGIRTIDIIDYSYGPGNRYWHTLGDDLNNTSARGLGIVGSVLLALIERGG